MCIYLLEIFFRKVREDCLQILVYIVYIYAVFMKER